MEKNEKIFLKEYTVNCRNFFVIVRGYPGEGEGEGEDIIKEVLGFVVMSPLGHSFLKLVNEDDKKEAQAKAQEQLGLHFKEVDTISFKEETWVAGVNLLTLTVKDMLGIEIISMKGIMSNNSATVCNKAYNDRLKRLMNVIFKTCYPGREWKDE